MKTKEKSLWQQMKVENDLRESHNTKRKKCDIKFYAYYRLYIPAEKETNSGVRKRKRV